MHGADMGGDVLVGLTPLIGMAKSGPDYRDNEGNSGWKATGNLNVFRYFALLLKPLPLQLSASEVRALSFTRNTLLQYFGSAVTHKKEN